jgi:signal transduction histidine kinase
VTLRTQLTLLYAGPFFVSGVALLAFPILQSNHTVPAGAQAGVGGSGVGAGDSQGNELAQLLVVSALGLAVMLVISFVLGWFIAGRFLRPLRTITGTARDISANNLHRRLSLGARHDEFAELADTLDDLFERLEAAFESQRHFVANASHELRTPLTAERALLQVALADPDAGADSLRSTCQDVLTLGQGQERLIEALLTLASSERGIAHREPFDLAEIAGDVVLARDQEARRRGVEVDVALAPAPATGDRSLVESLVANLVDNGLRHNTAGGGRLEIASNTSGGRARITVRNTGTVIPPDQLERLFQPFQRLDGQRIRRPDGPGYGHTDGHGLGLAIVRAIVSAHGATIVARARPEGGLDVEVAFPAARADA